MTNPWIQILPAGLSFIGMIAIAGVAWGKFNQLIKEVSARTTTLEDQMDTLRGHGMESVVTKQYCQNEKIACSNLVCVKIDNLQESFRQMEARREEARGEANKMWIHMAKIAQYIEDKDGTKIG